MVSLLDIAPQTDSVELPGGQQLTIYGVSAAGVAYLFKRFPEIRMLMSGIGVDRDKILDLTPTAIAALISCACGQIGSEQGETVAATLPLDVQMEIIDKAMVLTMPGGIGPFVARVQQFAAVIGGASSTKVQDSNLPLPSNASSPEGTTPTMSGPTRQKASRPGSKSAAIDAVAS